MSGCYELKKAKSGDIYFVLKASNGQTILQSEMYKSRSSAENGIASIRKNCPDDARYERSQGTNGKFHFNLKAANHQVIGSSQMYKTERSRDAGIESVKKNGISEVIRGDI